MGEAIGSGEQPSRSREELSSRLARLAVLRLEATASAPLSEVFAELSSHAGHSRYERLKLYSAQMYALREEYYISEVYSGFKLQRAERWIRSISSQLPNRQMRIDDAPDSFEPQSSAGRYSVAFWLRGDFVGPYRQMLDRVRQVAPSGNIAPIGFSGPAQFVSRFELPGLSEVDQTGLEVKLLASLKRLMEDHPEALTLDSVELVKQTHRLPVATPSKDSTQA